MSIKIAAFFATAGLALACGSDNKQTPADAAKIIDTPTVVVDGSRIDGTVPPDASTDAGVTVDASCFSNPDPNSHYQIINACTTALKVYTTHPKPPLLNADGTLPALP